MLKIPTIEEMLKAGMHFGHQTSRWHPKMKPYIFGAKNGIYIIDLVKSQEMLKNALELIQKSVSEDKKILFIGTKTQVKKEMKEMCKQIEMPYVVEKWMGGCLTNFSVLKKTIKKFKDLSLKKETGKLNKYTKKERLDFDREIEKLELKVGGLVSLYKAPDLVFVWDIKREATAINEAKKIGIPVIGVCDTNSNPKYIDHIIPANDDATKTIKLVLNCIRGAVEAGKANKTSPVQNTAKSSDFTKAPADKSSSVKTNKK